MKYDLKKINKARKLKGAKPLPIPTGQLGRPISARPEKSVLVRLYVKKDLSLRETSAALHVSKDIIRAALIENRIKRHGRRPSKLAKYRLAELRARIKADGLRATARALGVDPKTLGGYLARREPKR